MSDHISGSSWNATWNKEMMEILLGNEQQDIYTQLHKHQLDIKPETSYLYNTTLLPHAIQATSSYRNDVIQQHQVAKVNSGLQTMETDMQDHRCGESHPLSMMKQEERHSQSSAKLMNCGPGAAIKTESKEFIRISPNGRDIYRQHKEFSSQVNGQKIQITADLINQLILHKSALENGHSYFNLKMILRLINEFVTAHKCRELMRENDRILSPSTSFQEKYVLVVDGVPISHAMYAKAELQIDMKKIANSLFEDMFSPDEIMANTMKSRKLKSGLKSMALDCIRINVIYKVTAWIMNNRGRGNSYGYYNPNATNVSLTQTEISIVRDALGQKRNNCNQGKKENNVFKNTKEISIKKKNIRKTRPIRITAKST